MAAHLQPPRGPGDGSRAKHTHGTPGATWEGLMPRIQHQEAEGTESGMGRRRSLCKCPPLSVTAVHRQPRATRSRESYFLLPAQHAHRVSMGGGNQAATQHPWRQRRRHSVNRTSRGLPASVYINSQNAPNKKALILRLRHRENTFAIRVGAG